MSSMANKSIKNKKNSSKAQTFIKEAKTGRYGVVEKSSIKYVRMATKAEPFENKSQSVTYFGIR